MRLPLPNGEGLEKRAKETARDGSCLIGQLGELPNMATQDGETAKRSAVHPDVRQMIPLVGGKCFFHSGINHLFLLLSERKTVITSL